MRNCQYCKMDISHKHANAKFCDKKCKDSYWNKKDRNGVEMRHLKKQRKPRHEKTVKCEECGKLTPEHEIRETDLQDHVCPDCYHHDLDCREIEKAYMQGEMF